MTKTQYLHKNDGLENAYKEDAIETIKNNVTKNSTSSSHEYLQRLYSAPVNTVEDLLSKYKKYNLHVEDNKLFITGQIEVRYFTLLKKDCEKFNFTEITVINR